MGHSSIPYGGRPFLSRASVLAPHSDGPPLHLAVSARGLDVANAPTPPAPHDTPTTSNAMRAVDDFTPRTYKPAELLRRKSLGATSGINNSSFEFVSDAGRWRTWGNTDSTATLVVRDRPSVPVSNSPSFQPSEGSFSVGRYGLPLFPSEHGWRRWPGLRRGLGQSGGAGRQASTSLRADF